MTGILTNVDFDVFYKDLDCYKGFDFLINILKKPKLEDCEFYILNFDELNGGTHWVALLSLIEECGCGDHSYLNLYYIDSFGVVPSPLIIEYARMFNYDSLFYNLVVRQDEDKYWCGWFVMYVIEKMLRGHKFSSVLRSFDKKPTEVNENILEKYFKKEL